MSIGYNWEASGGNDSLTTTESRGWRKQSFGEPVRLWERQVQSRRYTGCGGYPWQSIS